MLKCIPIYAFILIVVGDKKARVKLAAMEIKEFKVCACNIQMPCVRNLRKINIAAEHIRCVYSYKIVLFVHFEGI